MQSRDSSYTHQKPISSICKSRSTERFYSSSAENLSPEDEHMLKHTQRQEPQGEEQVYISSSSSTSLPSPFMINSSTPASRIPENSATTTGHITIPSSRNNDSNLSIGGSSTNTLIIHHSVPDEPWSNQWLSGYSASIPSARAKTHANLHQSSEPPQPSSHANYANLKTAHESLMNSSLLNSSINSSLIDSNFNYGNKAASAYLGSQQLSPRLQHSNKFTVNDFNDNSFGHQSEILKHLISRESKDNLVTYSDQSASSSSSGLNLITETSSNSSRASQKHVTGTKGEITEADFEALVKRLPPPPAYPHWREPKKESTEISKAVDLNEIESPKPNLSRSQPDLTKIGANKDNAQNNRLYTTLPIDEDSLDPNSLKEMVNILTHENYTLKMALNIHRSKVSKLQKFESEMAKVEEHHEALMKLSERREQLERLARHKLQSELKKVNSLNAELKDQIREQNEGLNTLNSGAVPDQEQDRELVKRDVFIAQLVSQNKELVATKERQEIELCAQRQTLNEQRTHIDILDSALTSAQTNVIKLEEEVRQKQQLADQCGQLKRLLLSVRLASDRREQAEKNLRHNLEMDILQLKSNAKINPHSSEISDLRKDSRNKQERIMLLESELARWEHMAVQGVSSESTANKASGGKADTPLKLSELQLINKKQSDIETRNKWIEEKGLAEREVYVHALSRKAENYENLSSAIDNQGEAAARNSNNNAGLQKVSISHHANLSMSSQNNDSNVINYAAPRKDEELGEILL